MKLASYNVHGRASYGAVVGDSIVDLHLRLSPRYSTAVDLLRGNGLDEARAASTGVRPDFSLDDVELLPPLLAPEKILCIGVNYANRSTEVSGGAEAAKYPSMFYRAPNSLVGHNRPLVCPPESDQLDYEGEVAIVIGREGRRIPRVLAMEHVCGYMLCNEGSIRDWMRHGRFNVTQGKNFDASGSIGPWMTTADEIDRSKPLRLTVKLNGEITQDDTTANMIFSFADLIAYVSTFMTLKPADIIVTGTPVKLGAKTETPVWLKPGDILEISVPELGTLRNQVIAER
jgi:2-keto-4-pentenoate hydratase/2-oxohepta-3-ene-1,7-dioic acid hydratase in catechol pathway